MRRFAELFLGCLVVFVGCSSSSGTSPVSADAGPVPGPGETCDPTTAPNVLVHFDPPQLILAPGGQRPVRVIVDPDMCAPVTGTVTMKDPSVASAPSSAPFDLRHPTFDFEVKAEKAGTTSLTVSVQRPADPTVNFAGDMHPATGTLPIDVRASAAPPTCSSTTATTTALSSSATTAKGAGDVAEASLSVPVGAFARTDDLALPAFSAGISCGGDLTRTATPAGLLPLGPAVTFTPQDPTWLTHSLRRELAFTIPVNPAAMPAAGRMRHLQVLYSGPMAKKPRVVTIANPHFAQLPNGDWVVGFQSPWFGTYQAAVASNAGTVHFARHLTHRAVLGISMGGGGAGILGTRHHDQFDVIAPLGGNSELTWIVWFFEHFKFGGFCTAANPNCTKYAPNLYPLWETFAHTEDFDHWFFQPGGGTGGNFGRGEWTQILEDFAIMGGNPNGQNADPAIPFMVTGPKSTDPFVQGTMSGDNCAVVIDPISPNDNDSLAMQQQEKTTEQQQQQTQTACRAAQCNPQNAWVAKTGFYDADYNPTGSLPVVSFCDGGQKGTAPYVDTWAPGGQVPSDLTLAVDLNGNGIRDVGEPVIRQGHEPFTDSGTDGIADANEPGYDPTSNPDPNGDDYDFAINASGTENDHVWEQGEPFLDYGVDGVQHTPSQSQGGYDVGEGDGQFTLTTGAQQLYAIDPHQMLRGHAMPAGGPLDTTALHRFDVWTDGGVRDMANFGAVANHLIGSFAVPRNADGSQVKSTVFYDNFENLPGADPTQPDNFLAEQVLWADVASAAHLRFGDVDATPAMIAQGDGQHVGTGAQILDRIVTGFYFAGSRWPDADRLLPAPVETGAGGNVETTTANELGTQCEILGHCDTYFTGPTTHRTGPIAVTLPPGYALEANRAGNMRYPVLFMLHGYGQDPRDLQATAAITGNYMRDALKSSADRLAKMIVVYADGRCRIDPTTNAPECIRGTFYLNEHREVNGHAVGLLDDWFEELMQYIDKNYRTLGPSDVDWVE